MRARACGAGTDARLKIVLRLKIAFVGQVVYRELEIDPRSNLFRHAQIENVEARSAQSLSLPKLLHGMTLYIFSLRSRRQSRAWGGARERETPGMTRDFQPAREAGESD